MSGPQFFQTGMGQKFLEHTVPELVRHIARLAAAAERIATALEARATVPCDPRPDEVAAPAKAVKP